MKGIVSPTFSRRSLLKGSGVLLIGFSLAPGLRGQDLRTPVAGPPPGNQIDSWIAIHRNNTATLYIGFVELGQGATTALQQVAAEELDLGLDQLSTVWQDTHLTPNQGGTYSSSAIRNGRPQVQRAAAEARQALLAMAADRLQIPAGNLVVERGVISGHGDDNVFTTYGELIGDRSFNIAFTGTAPLKDPDNYRLTGRPLPRKDIADKAAGTYTHIQHARLPGMLHGRILRPRGQGAYQDGVQIASVNEDSIAGIPARVLRQGNFLAVVAAREWDAVRAAQALEVEWQRSGSLPGNSGLFREMQYAETNDRIAVDDGDLSAFDSATVSSRFEGHGPYQAHAPFAPNCALADVSGDSAFVICASQDIYNARTGIAALLGLPETSVRVQYMESSGTYGHSCWDDAAQAAALMSQLAGAPVRLQFMRHDEHGWDTYGPAHLGMVRAAADGEGKLLAYEYDGWQHHWSLVETTTQSATGAAAAEWPAFPAQQINPLCLGGQYHIPNRQLRNHHVPGLPWLKAAWLRSPLDLSFTFVSEQAIDDLAWQLGMDPVVFRRQNILDERWQGVLDAAAEAADWQPRHAGSRQQDGELRTGRGVGLGTHLASWGGAVADIEVNVRTGDVRVLHLYGAIDAGMVVNTSNVANQLIGQLVQTTSRMLLEEVRFDNEAVTSLDWNSYPILRMEDCPEVTPVIVQRSDQPSLGAGEEVMAAAAAAIANAFFDATGKRMQQYPFTPPRVLAALI